MVLGILLYVIFIYFSVLKIEPRAFSMLGKCSTTQFILQLSMFYHSVILQLSILFCLFNLIIYLF